jgi:TatD DNase family protein
MSDTPIWIDSHAHLTMFPREDLPEILERAESKGVAGVLVPATGEDDLELALDLANEHSSSLLAAAGLHPHDASSLDAGLKLRLERSLDHRGVVAVGEIGLDYHYMNSPKEDQLAALDWQLDLALEADLPVVLHNRESWADLESVLTARRGRLRGVCHSFAEGPAAARRVIELGLWIGISGMVTFRAADNIREMVTALDPNRVLVETDSPYLAPVPHRGKRNEPSFVPLVGKRLAEELGISVEDVATRSTAGFRELFAAGDRWPAPPIAS